MSRNGERALVVDDDAVSREFVRRAIDDRFSDLVEAETYEEALAEGREGSFGLIVLDYRLPDGDGVAILEELRADGVEAPVIMLTGQGDEQVAVQAMKAGAADYLTKDQLTETRLSQTVDNVLQAERTRREVQRLSDALADQERVALIGTLSDASLDGLAHGVAELEWLFSRLRGQLSDPDPEALENLQDEMREALSALARLINVVASFRRLLKVGPEPEPSAVDPIVESVAKARRSTVPPHVTIETEVGDVPEIPVDERALRYVLHQLINNAVEATPEEGGTVRIRTETGEAGVVIVVEDEGPGFPADLREHAFHLHVSDKEDHQGVGLTVARHLVEAHGGTIAIGDSSQGGARVTVRLPPEGEG